MDRPVEDGISQGRVTDSFMPVRDRQLTGDDSRVDIIAVFKYFQEIRSTLVIERLKPPVIDDEELGSGQSGEHSSIAAIGSGNAQLLKEPGETKIRGLIILPAGFLTEGTGHKAFSYSSWSGNKHIEMFFYPPTGRKLKHQRLIQTTGGAIVDILHRGI